MVQENYEGGPFPEDGSALSIAMAGYTPQTRKARMKQAKACNATAEKGVGAYGAAEIPAAGYKLAKLAAKDLAAHEDAANAYKAAADLKTTARSCQACQAALRSRMPVAIGR